MTGQEFEIKMEALGEELEAAIVDSQRVDILTRMVLVQTEMLESMANEMKECSVILKRLGH